MPAITLVGAVSIPDMLDNAVDALAAAVDGPGDGGRAADLRPAEGARGGQPGRPGGDVEDLRLPRKDLLREHAVYLVVGVGARVAQDGEAEVEVGRLAEGRQDDATRGDPA